MAVTTFAAIDVGSYEVSMKIFELSRKVGFKELTDIRYRLELGKGAYSRGRLEGDMVDALCEILLDFKRVMKEFGAEEYRACATSVFRELKNPIVILEQVFQTHENRKDLSHERTHTSESASKADYHTDPFVIFYIKYGYSNKY